MYDPNKHNTLDEEKKRL